MQTCNTELVRYNSWSNRRIIAILNTEGRRPSDKCVELISHILNVHQIWNSRIRLELAGCGPWKVRPVTSLSEIDKFNTDYRRGQIASELRNCGIEPPLTDLAITK